MVSCISANDDARHLSDFRNHRGGAADNAALCGNKRGLAAAGWLRGDRAHAYRVVFAVSVWLVAAALFASPRMGIGRRTFLGALGGYVASAFAQFVVCPLIENRAIASPLYESVVRFGIAPMFLAPLATLGWAAGALMLLSASGADALRRRLLHQLE